MTDMDRLYPIVRRQRRALLREAAPPAQPVKLAAAMPLVEPGPKADHAKNPANPKAK